MRAGIGRIRPEFSLIPGVGSQKRLTEGPCRLGRLELEAGRTTSTSPAQRFNFTRLGNDLHESACRSVI